MNAFLRDYRLIWQYAIQHRHSNLVSGSFGMIGLGVLALAVILLFVAANSGNRLGGAALGVGFIAMLVSVFWWFRFIRGAVIYNIPACAMLVPRVRRRAVQATLLTWLLTAAIVAWFIAAQQDRFYFGIAFACASAGLLWVGFLFSSPTTPDWIVAPLFVIGGIESLLPSGLSGAAWLVYLPLMAAVGYYVIQAAFMRGGDRHQQFAWHAYDMGLPLGAKKRSESPMLPPVPDLAPVVASEPPAPVYASVGISYANTLARDCASGADRTSLIMHVLGPSCDRRKISDVIRHLGKTPLRLMARLLLPLVGMLLGFALLLRFVLPWLNGAQSGAFSMVGWVVLSPLLYIQLVSPKRYVRFVEKTMAEQKLFRLSPCLPSSAALNRELTMGLVRCALGDWFCWTCALMALDLLMGTAYSYLLIKFCLCAMCMPFVSALVHDYSRAKIQLEFAATAVSVIVLMLVFIMPYSQSSATLVIYAPAAWPWLVGLDLTNTLWAIGFLLGNAALTAVLVALRLRMLAKAPVAFPAGRRTN